MADEPAALRDRLGRPLGDLRVSVTDHCNLRCRYCMPEEEYTWLPKDQILSYEEIGALVDAFTELGVDKVRLTGGEPLLRRGLPTLVEALAARPAVRDLAMTTNGVLLDRQLDALKQAGLGRVTVSVDTLRPDRAFALTKRDHLDRVIAAIRAIPQAGFTRTKLDTVVMRGFNDDELVDLLEFSREVGAELRFIEYMDVGGATHWSAQRVLPRREMVERVAAHYGEVRPVEREGRSATAARYRLPDGLVFGVVSSTTQPFCGACNRSRLTADGTWYTCLYSEKGVDLRTPLREGRSHAELVELIREVWAGRADRGAEERLTLIERGPAFGSERLRDDPRLEMHTRGG